MLVVGLVIAVPVTLIIRGDDGPPPPDPIIADLPKLGPVEFERDLGIKLRLPEGWKSEREGEVIMLRSADRQAQVAVSAPGPAEDSEQLHDELLGEFGDTYEDVEVPQEKEKSRVGGLKGKASTIEAVDSEERDVGILVTTAEGKEKAYLVVAYTPLTDPTTSTLEAQTLINELKFVD